MHPLILDATRALTAVALISTTAAMLILQRPIPEPLWPVLVAVISYLYPPHRNNHQSRPPQTSNPREPSSPRGHPDETASLPAPPQQEGGNP